MAERRPTKSKQTHRVTPDDARLRKPEQPQMIALLGTVAALAGGFTLVVGLLWWLVTKSFGLGPKAFIIIGVVCLAYAIATNLRTLTEAFRQRRIMTGANAVFFSLLVFASLVLLNYVAIRHSTLSIGGRDIPLYFRHDATESKQFSLSDQTVKILRSLNEDIEFRAYISPGYYQQAEIRDRLGEYDRHGPRVKVNFYDPTLNREKVLEDNVTTDGTIIVQSGERKEEVMGGDEERLTSAILAVTTGEKTKIYFLSGHGEYDPTEYGPDSCNTIKQGLESQQYAVETLSLMNDPKIPADCAALVIAGAKSPLKDEEMDAIEKYADQGGKLFIALATTRDAPDFSGILKTRGVTPIKGVVRDPHADHHVGGTPRLPAVRKPEAHEITKGVEGYILVLPATAAFEVEAGDEPPPSYPGGPPPQPTKKAAELLKTSADAWVDAIDDETGAGNEEKDGDEQTGPLAMAIAIDESKKEPPTPPGMGMPPPPEDEGEPTGTRIVAVGSAEMMTDNLIQSSGVYGNGYFVLSSIAWLVSDEKLISIPPKETETPYLTMADAQKAIAAVLVLIIIPGLVVLAGGLVWWQRRR